MSRLNVKIIEDKCVPEDRSILKYLKDWESLIYGSDHTDYRLAEPEELPEDIRPFVLQLRQQLKSRGVDPSTVYPVDFYTDLSDKHYITMTITYDSIKGDKLSD